MKKKTGSTATRALLCVLILAELVIAGVVIWYAGSSSESHPERARRLDYDLSRYRKTDPKLVLYRELAEARIATGMDVPLGVSLDAQGRIYIAGDKAVHIFERNGKSLVQLALDAKPRCLAVGADGRLFVVFRRHVGVYDASGRQLAKWPDAGEKAVFTSIAMTGDRVFVADAGRRVVRLYDRQGMPKGQIDGFLIPSAYFDVAIAPDGLLRVADTGRHRIMAFTLDREPRGHWGGRRSMAIEDLSGCCNPISFAMTAGGQFVTAEKGLTRVKLYAGDGKFLGVVAGAESFARHDEICAGAGDCNRGGLDVAVDAAGRVLVLDPLTADVRIFVRKETSDETR